MTCLRLLIDVLRAKTPPATIVGRGDFIFFSYCPFRFLPHSGHLSLRQIAGHFFPALCSKSARASSLPSALNYVHLCLCSVSIPKGSSWHGHHLMKTSINNTTLQLAIWLCLVDRSLPYRSEHMERLQPINYPSISGSGGIHGHCSPQQHC